MPKLAEEISKLQSEDDEFLKKFGSFSINAEKSISGELTVAREKTSLYLQDDEYFDLLQLPDNCILGVLNDRTKVSLHQCISSGTGSYSSKDDRYNFANIFPHYIIYGDYHLTPTEDKISEVHFRIDDASTLFYDFDAFGSISNANNLINDIVSVNEKLTGRKIETGPNAQICYFAGKRKIFESDTVFGIISANHSPNYSMGGPDGVHIKNRIYITIKFKKLTKFNDAINSILITLRYFELLIGRTQNLFDVYLSLPFEKSTHYLPVYFTLPHTRNASRAEERNPHPSDILLDAVSNHEIFSKVFANWLERDSDWSDARLRFFESFSDQRYGINRLINCANMFDILPNSAVPSDVELSDDLKNAKNSCSNIFTKLDNSIERDSILGALGRLGKSNLKQKIRHRVKIITNVIGVTFPDLNFVTDAAVNCRNHYVHGSCGDFRYNENFNAVVFFTNTLEFVFAISDLIESGWDAKVWIGTGTVMSHPFGAYKVNYGLCLNNLKELMKN